MTNPRQHVRIYSISVSRVERDSRLKHFESCIEVTRLVEKLNLDST
jgi:hypothetical protein